MIENILKENKKIKLNEQFMAYLKVLEKFIPQQHINNFYQNLKTVQIKYNQNNMPTNANGYYDIVNNTIFLQSEQVITTLQKYNIEQKKIINSLNQLLLHEFVHLASSKYNKETKELYTGYEIKGQQTNEGLNEGMSEFISLSIVRPKINMNTDYKIETDIIRQLYCIIGQNPLLESFFSNTGTDTLELELNKINSDKKKSNDLLRLVESNYIIRNSEYESDNLFNIQNILLEYFNKKLNLLQKENKQNEINELIYSYETSLITPDRINQLTNLSQKYLYLEKNKQIFNEIVQKYETRQISIQKK